MSMRRAVLLRSFIVISEDGTQRLTIEEFQVMHDVRATSDGNQIVPGRREFTSSNRQAVVSLGDGRYLVGSETYFSAESPTRGGPDSVEAVR